MSNFALVVNKQRQFCDFCVEGISDGVMLWYGGGVSGGHEATLRKRLAFVQIKGWGGGVGGLAEDLPLRMLAANLG